MKKRIVVTEGKDAAPEAVRSVVIMFEHLGFSEAASSITNAIETVYAEGRTLTPDQGGSAFTTEFCKAVAREL